MALWLSFLMTRYIYAVHYRRLNKCTLFQNEYCMTRINENASKYRGETAIKIVVGLFLGLA